MNSIPAILEPDPRAKTARAPSDEARRSSETKFQDAVESRRAAQARASEEHAKSRASAENAKSSDAKERASDTEEHSADAPADRSDPAQESASESESSASTASQRPAHTRGSNTPRNATPDALASEESTAPQHVARAADQQGSVGSSEPTGDADASATSAPGVPLTNLEALLARALPHGNATTTSASRVASIADGGDATSELSTGQPAASKASTTATFATDALRALQHDARDVDAPSASVDPRTAPATTAAAHTTETAAPEPPPPARLAPAELPRLFDGLAVRIATPERQAHVELAPPELGRMRISLAVEPGGHVRAEMHAQRPDGYAALEARLSDLHANLIERGFTSASLSLSLGLADPHSRQSGAQRDTGRSPSVAHRTLADAEVRALVPASVGVIDMWA